MACRHRCSIIVITSGKDIYIYIYIIETCGIVAVERNSYRRDMSINRHANVVKKRILANMVSVVICLAMSLYDGSIM